MPEATIAAVERGADPAAGGPDAPFNMDEALVVRFGRDLLQRHRVDDATFAAARARFGERGVVELVATFGYYALLACVLNAAEVEPA